MYRRAAIAIASLLAFAQPCPATAQDIVRRNAALADEVDRLRSEVDALRSRLDALGPASASREVRIADPVFVGAGAVEPSPLAMDDPIINCPRRSFVSVIQILKTGNTVTQIRYACRAIE